jgi:taurine dioxygenase
MEELHDNERVRKLPLRDNWRMMHCVTGTRSGVRRVIHRTTIMGHATLGRVLNE